MHIKIINDKLNDYYVFESSIIESAREIVDKENKKRAWNNDDCHSEIVPEPSI